MESCIDINEAIIISRAVYGFVWCWDLVKAQVSKLEHSPGVVVNSIHPHPSKSALVSAGGPTINLWSKPEYLDSDTVN